VSYKNTKQTSRNYYVIDIKVKKTPKKEYPLSLLSDFSCEFVKIKWCSCVFSGQSDYWKNNEELLREIFKGLSAFYFFLHVQIINNYCLNTHFV
jgi:hypothetical protein